MKRLLLLSALILIYSSQLFAQRRQGPNRRPVIGVSTQVHTNPRPVASHNAPVIIHQHVTPVHCAPVYVAALDNYKFQSVYNTVANQPFDSGKLCIAEQVIHSNYLYSWQVKELMSLLSFESTKLEMAKMAYVKTIDKENYFLVNDAFTFSSSIRELNRHLY